MAAIYMCDMCGHAQQTPLERQKLFTVDRVIDEDSVGYTLVEKPVDVCTRCARIRVVDKFHSFVLKKLYEVLEKYDAKSFALSASQESKYTREG